MSQLTQVQMEILVGVLLGDCHAQRGSVKGNTRLQFEQGTVNSEYLVHLYSVFAPYCGTAPKVYTRPSGRASISFQTLSSPIFTEFHDLFYSNGVKIVPPTIGHLLTARGLAYWSMD
jgi:hypothetical protein